MIIKSILQKLNQFKNPKFSFCNKQILDPLQYRLFRKKILESVQKYPYNFKKTCTFKEFIKKYQNIKSEDKIDNQYNLAGRITTLRKHGKIIFIDIRQQHIKLQIVAYDLPSYIKRGDIIGVTGNPFKTMKGELSIKSKNIKLLSPCLNMLPEHNALKDSEIRYRKRYLDLITNPQSLQKIIIRSKIIQFLRNYLIDKQYIQVETPYMSRSAGGAVAKPFQTYLHQLDMKLYMRIAPELYLKQLLIGGIQKVFQIGKNFRNEGMDQTHNPQFTSCELYASYHNYYDMINLTEDLISQLVYKIKGTYEIEVIDDKGNKAIINFKTPWKRVSMISQLQKLIGIQFPNQFGSEQSQMFLDNLCKQKNVECTAPRSSARLLDKLAGKYLQNLHSPLFIMDHPKVMSPLAKSHSNNPQLCQRFELFINGWEVVNSYTQLNDPVQQLKNTPEDKQYVESLEYGLMPCAGWGIGIDRLVMLLTNSKTIQQIIIFPLMKQQQNSKDQKE